MAAAAQARQAAQVSGQDVSAMPDPISMLLDSFKASGLQSTQFALAEELITEMIRSKTKANVEGKPKKSRLFLAYTSNLISSGLREVFAELVRNDLVDGIVTTAGGIEEDYIKCLGATVLGDFALRGDALRKQGLNRVGNLLIPNANYVAFEDFFTPILKEIHKQQMAAQWEVLTGPSEIIQKIGEHLAPAAEKRAKQIAEWDAKHPDDLPQLAEGEERKAEDERPKAMDINRSVGYWCSEKKVPVFCPALTDGSIGDMVFFFNFGTKGLVIDPIVDLMKFEDLCGVRYEEDRQRKESAAAVEEEDPEDVNLIILGGGLPKHHLMRSIYTGFGSRTNVTVRVVNVSTALPTDGTVSCPSVEQDREMRLAHLHYQAVAMHADATLVFPLMMSRAFQHLKKQ